MITSIEKLKVDEGSCDYLLIKMQFLEIQQIEKNLRENQDKSLQCLSHLIK